jgi:hypothetical protein
MAPCRHPSVRYPTLSDVGLIKRWPLVVPVGDERIPVSGVYCIDEAALTALDDRTLIEVRSALGMIYAQLLSMGQVSVLTRLLLVQQQMTQGRPLRDFCVDHAAPLPDAG